MWGPAIVGFGAHHYVNDSGHSRDAALVGFSPRKGDISICICICIVNGFERYGAHLARLGGHKIGKVCLTVKRLADIDTAVLKEMAENSIQAMAAQRVATKRGAAT